MTTYLKWGFDQMSFSHFYTGERSHHFLWLLVFSMEPVYEKRVEVCWVCHGTGNADCFYCDGKGCPVCKQGGWIELCPCGMIHPNVLKMGGIDPEEYQGFAFGLGLSRLTMMSFGINNIRKLNGGNIKDLSQAKLK